MKKFLMAVLLLSGCANPAQQPFDRETKGWQIAENRAAIECFGGKPVEESMAAINRRNVDKYRACADNIASVEVEPYVVYPDLYAEMRLSGVKNKEQFKKGVISKEQYIAQAKANFANYIGSVNARAQQFAMADQQLRLQRSQAFMNLSNSINQQQTNNAMVNAMNRPRMTNCHNTFGGVSCTSY